MIRKAPWLALPLLFLPQLGLGEETEYGTLETSDYVIGIYLAFCVISSSGRRCEPWAKRFFFLAALFVLWSLIGVLSLPLRYEYYDTGTFVFCWLKLCKFALYIAAGWATSVAARRDRGRGLEASLFAAGVVVATCVFLWPSESRETRGIGYTAGNATSLILAIIFSYFLALRWSGKKPSFVRPWVFALGTVVMFGGLAVSRGRGAWVACLAAVAFTGLKNRERIGSFALRTITVVVAAILAYFVLEPFRYDVDRTLNPDPAALREYEKGIAGIDDGARLVIWRRESAKWVENPLLGTGFFHRGGRSGLWSAGSHNFFLQVWLETGIVGLAILLLLMRTMWKGASGASRARSIASRSALVAALTGGLSGEYFYGGIGLFLATVIWQLGGFSDESDELRKAQRLAGNASMLLPPAGSTRSALSKTA